MVEVQITTKDNKKFEFFASYTFDYSIIHCIIIFDFDNRFLCTVYLEDGVHYWIFTGLENLTNPNNVLIYICIYKDLQI